jgi:hypothetical protein
MRLLLLSVRQSAGLLFDWRIHGDEKAEGKSSGGRQGRSREAQGEEEDLTRQVAL